MRLDCKYLLVSIFIGLLMGCSSSDDGQNQIARMLQDSEGLDISLGWNPQSVNLDLFIQAVDADESEFSIGSGNGETVDLNSSYPDGTYVVGVEFFNGDSNATYSVTAQEKTGDPNGVQINGTIGPNTNSLIDREVLTIIKDGNLFEVEN